MIVFYSSQARVSSFKPKIKMEFVQASCKNLSDYLRCVRCTVCSCAWHSLDPCFSNDEWIQNSYNLWLGYAHKHRLFNNIHKPLGQSNAGYQKLHRLFCCLARLLLVGRYWLGHASLYPTTETPTVLQTFHAMHLVCQQSNNWKTLWATNQQVVIPFFALRRGASAGEWRHLNGS